MQAPYVLHCCVKKQEEDGRWTLSDNIATIKTVILQVKWMLLQATIACRCVCNTRCPWQVYIPFVNYLLMVLCIIIIAVFQTSDRLGQAYGAHVFVF